MTPPEYDAANVRQQLDRILESPGFARNERLSRFLRFVVEGRLEGRGQELKESVLAVQIFGRPPGYDSKRDAVVRTEAGRLRARLSEYYLIQGRDDELVIELPKGGYVPVFHCRTAAKTSRWLKVALPPSWVGVGIAVVMFAAAAGWWWMRQSAIPGLRRYEASEAYGLYRRARAAYHPGREVADADVDLYQQAIEKDRAFAPGYAGLAAAYAFASSRPIGDRKDGLVKMRAAAQRAMELDPLLAEGEDAMGIVSARLGKWDSSGQSFRRAIELDPRRSVTRLDYVMNLLLPLGWIGNALQQLRIAETSDPHSADVHDVYSYVLISAGRFNEAEEHCSKSVTPGECLPRIRMGQGRIEEAIHMLTVAPNPRYLGYAYGRAGRRAEAEELAAISPGALQQVLIYAGLGDKDRTFQALDRMTDLGPVRVGRTLTYPELRLLHGDPRLVALRKKLGLPE